MHPGDRCELVDWGEVQRLARDLARRLRRDGFAPDVIVAIARGGWIPGRLLSDYLGVLNLTDLKVEHYVGTVCQEAARIRYPLRADVSGQRVLLVDDVTDTGESFALALEHILGSWRPSQLRTLALHHKSDSPYVPDYFARQVAEWRWIIYPWALVEDLTALIQGMEDRPGDAAGLARRLWCDHGIRVPPESLVDILDLMKP